MKSNFEKLKEILDGKFIKPVYQPIVSLADGQILGYEALSRISNKKLNMNIEEMFKTADKFNKSWELEALCRTKSLENYLCNGKQKNLFIKVNSNIIHDEKFKEGFTKNRLNEYRINCDNIVFEITERVSVIDSNAFLRSVKHYKDQDYKIAIDEKVENIYKILKTNPTITEFCIIAGESIVGFMTKTDLTEVFGGRYGFSLHSKKFIKQLMRTDFLRVDYTMTIDDVSKLAMQRSYEQLYDPIVVEKNNKYLGIVTVKDLLDAHTKIEIDVAMRSNPLTGMPGNLSIEREILSRILGEQPH